MERCSGFRVDPALSFSMIFETELDPDSNNAALWDARYREKDIPWDKSEATPVLVDLLVASEATGTSWGHVLVIGCGCGHDAGAIAGAGENIVASVTAIDLSETAVGLARAAYPLVDAQQQDLFDLPDDFAGAFDTVWEHTCFCAIHPHQREAYIRAVRRALKPGGQLIGLFFTIEKESHDGPPFKSTQESIRATFGAVGGFKEVEAVVPKRTFPKRVGQVTLFRFQAV